MPDYTDPHLIPFPTEEDYGDGSNYLEEAARVIDPLQVALSARLTALSTKPTVIRNRTTNQAFTSGTVIDFSNSHHDNFSPVISSTLGWSTPAVGAHPVAGVYPAIWRLDLWVFSVETAPTLGDGHVLEVEQWQMSDALGREDIARQYTTQATDTTTGGEYLSLSFMAALSRPARFLPKHGATAIGNIQAGSWMSMTRIRSI